MYHQFPGQLLEDDPFETEAFASGNPSCGDYSWQNREDYYEPNDEPSWYDTAGWHSPSDAQEQDLGKSVLARYVNDSGWDSPLDTRHNGVDYSNLYRYVFNSPMNAIDPSGMEEVGGALGEISKSTGAKLNPPKKGDVGGAINLANPPNVRPNDSLAPGAKFVSVYDEIDSGVYNQAGSFTAVPTSIKLTALGQPATVKGDPWRAGVQPVMSQSKYGRGQLALEWVLSFSEDPRKCSWGRFIWDDKGFKTDDSGGVVSVDWDMRKDDTEHGDDYIIGNNVYMFDGPNVEDDVFLIWARSWDHKTELAEWYRLSGLSGSISRINPPQITFSKSKVGGALEAASGSSRLTLPEH